MYNHFPFGFRLPAGPGGAREDLLFSVWEYADQHPEVFGGRTGMGPQTLKETVGEILGMPDRLVHAWSTSAASPRSSTRSAGWS